MNVRMLLLVAMLTASLCTAKKNPTVEHVWQTSTLLKILRVDELGHFGDRELNMSGQLSSPVGGGVMLVIQGQSSIVVARLLPVQKEPNIQLRGPVKYAIETVRCRFTDNCGSRTTPSDEFGRTRQEKITTLTYLYLLDGDNRVSRLTAVNEHKLPLR